jgi:RND superfamily putative drug exporter
VVHRDPGFRDRSGLPREGQSGAARKKGVAARLARAIVWLRFPILLAWAVAVLATTSLPSLFEADTGELGNLLPHDSEALTLERDSVETFGLPFLSHTMAVAGDPRGLSARQQAGAARYVAGVDRRPSATLRAVPLLNLGPLAQHRAGTTVAAFTYSDPSLPAADREEEVRRFADGLARSAGLSRADVTGTLPATGAQTHLTEEWLPWLELATVILVVVILAFYFRAVGVPLLGLATVGIAYLCASHSLGWLGLRYDVSIPQEVNPVIVALLFGTLTDYVVFFVSGYRNRLAGGAEPLEAATDVTAELLPVVFTASLMIAGATLTLLVSGVQFLSAFGPGNSVAVLTGAAVALTFVPATIAIFGRTLLWPGRTHEEAEPAAGEGARGRIVGVAASHPAIVATLCVLVLLAAASGIRDLALGNPVIRGLPDGNSVHRGYDTAAASFGPGATGPSALVVEGEGIGKERNGLTALQTGLAEQDGVSAVLGPAQQPLPQRGGAVIAPSGDAARFLVVLDADPNGTDAIGTLEELESRLPELLRASGLGTAEAGFAGDTAIASELTDATQHAFLRIAPLAIAVLLLLLWLLLRNRSAPLYLVGVSALVVLASLGLTVYLFQDLLGYGELVFFVPVATAILLLALGSDYNVFLVSRIWREADRQDLRPAIRTAGSQAGRAITVAGITLALSFALVAMIPVLAFRELAFAMAAGLVLDTMIARTLLIPALVSLFGRGELTDRKGDADVRLAEDDERQAFDVASHQR